MKRSPFPAFEFRSLTRLVAGEGSIDKLGPVARELGGRRALVVSDPGVVAAGHAGVGVESLRRAGLDVECFSGFGENPTTLQVDTGVSVAKAFGPDILVGLGGGSSMDCCKGINFIHALGGTIADYRGRERASAAQRQRAQWLPSVAVPTTAGTGSETQSFALITDTQSGVKMACGDSAAAFRVAILDPRLTLTLPRRVTALTGVDAVSHAIESHVSRAATPASRVFSREAWRLLCHALPCVLADGRDLPARSAVQLAAAWAGLAIENSMLGAAHAMANPLTAAHGTVHGQAVGLVLPHVVRFNASVAGPRYAELWSDLSGEEADPHAAEKLASWLDRLLGDAGLERSLGGLGIRDADPAALAADAVTQWTGGFNPHQVSLEDYRLLYEALR